MSEEDLLNEVEAINAIYGDGSLVATEEANIYVLSLPQHGTSVRIQFPHEYPDVPPAVLGAHSSGEHTRKGEASHVVELLRDVLGRLFRPGEVCMFDVIEEVNTALGSVEADPEIKNVLQQEKHTSPMEQDTRGNTFTGSRIEEEPQWILSEVVIELKSVFVARSAPVSSPAQAKRYVGHLLENDKKVRAATHNITAWRIREENGITYQDCDDDGESAAGGRLLHLLQLMEVWNVMVVVSRWYGGQKLGPHRFSLINQVARDALIKGDFVKEDGHTRKKGKR